MTKVVVPAYFFEDHLNRLNDATSMRKSIAKAQGSKYTVNLTDSQLSNLFDDALYHSNASDMSQECRGLSSSARATVRALEGFFE